MSFNFKISFCDAVLLHDIFVCFAKLSVCWESAESRAKQQPGWRALQLSTPPPRFALGIKLHIDFWFRVYVFPFWILCNLNLRAIHLHVTFKTKTKQTTQGLQHFRSNISRVKLENDAATIQERILCSNTVFMSVHKSKHYST